MSADLVMKRRDTYPKLKATLTQNGTPIDLSLALAVVVIMKPQRTGGTTIERPCTGPAGGSVKSASGVNAGKVEYAWHQDDLTPAIVPETYNIEFEIEWPEVSGVKQLQTVPNGEEPAPVYRTIEVVQDLGGVGGA